LQPVNRASEKYPVVWLSAEFLRFTLSRRELAQNIRACG
jgi:hypothetical protein